MPRKIELTWQPGSRGRKGRWRKKYLGKSYYFAFGTAKSDKEGYRLALEAWKRKKEQLDEEEALRPRLHQADYEAAIQEWTLVLQWSRENDDQQHAGLALQKVEVLKQRLADPQPPPLGHDDRIWGRFTLPKKFLDSVTAILDLPRPTPGAVGNYLPSQRLIESMDGSPGRIATEIWKDRLAVQRRKSQEVHDTVGANIDTFLTAERGRVTAGEISAGRYDPLRTHLEHFRAWLGADLPLSSITSKILLDYHAVLLQGTAGTEKKWSADYAKDRMNAVKQFVRWLWRIEAIQELPRVLLDRKALRISKKVGTPPVFTIVEVKKLLGSATPRSKLYLLLMLNTGMTQKDISDLRQSEVDWKSGKITRRRSKTAKHDTVPVVSYKLWGETFRLLKQERSNDAEVVLTNTGGGRLKVEELDGQGKLRKIDNVSTAFNRLKRAAKISMPLKAFRKTSATLLRGEKGFNGVEDLFLGHAPRTMSDRHYAQVPQALLDEAVAWLGKQYGVK